MEEFLKAKYTKLSRRHRSEDHDDHAELLNKMSAGERIEPDDLKKTYKLLQEEDTEFEFATILTSGNQKRQEFNTVQSVR